MLLPRFLILSLCFLVTMLSSCASRPSVEDEADTIDLPATIQAYFKTIIKHQMGSSPLCGAFVRGTIKASIQQD